MLINQRYPLSVCRLPSLTRCLRYSLFTNLLAQYFLLVRGVGTLVSAVGQSVRYNRLFLLN